MKKIEVWEEAQKKGFLEGKEKYAMYPEEYKWMIKQMKKKLTNYTGEHPIWVWLKKPDMRTTGHFSGGTKCVRIKLELDKEKVLISDFDRWHTVLNDSFCSDNEVEDEDFYSGKLKITKEESWQRIFELDRNADVSWIGTGEWLQGVTGRISLDSVISVEEFVTRKSQFD